MENFGQHLQFVYSAHCDLHCVKLELVLAQAAPIPPIGISTCVSPHPQATPSFMRDKIWEGPGDEANKRSHL